MGTHHSRIDAKGRMSIPAPFRAALRSLAQDGTAALVLRPSHVLACIDGWPAANFAGFAAKFEQMETFSLDREDLATALFSDAWQMEADKEGRIIVPETLVEHAALADTVTFFGMGDKFQIWQPEAAAARRKVARANAADRGLTLPGARP